MTRFLSRFASDESGAVTVEWVVLTAAVVTLAYMAATGIQTSAVGAGDVAISNAWANKPD
ncbi:hypothetical protein ROJ8625_03833 [Roseivivax jejudonensis]|uniref:Flp/Fap pilin component n=1 Tax=Roseivivax jejudonensis TaxID=1529041 RepID=A0A1X7A7V8_9RHOB|nr:hypothetical protein [Roseivivax jejudonensis]SLN72433.1 hypothetical protein ROJ8625_03833 [Roseivivax jejudonensis]